MSALSQCSGCQRHVKRTEAACPFCGVVIVHAAPAALPATRLGRAALLAVGALGAGATAIACEPRAVYGGPPVEMVDAGPTPPISPSGASTATPPPPPTTTAAPSPTGSMKANDPHQMPVPAYGMPPVQKP